MCYASCHFYLTAITLLHGWDSSGLMGQISSTVSFTKAHIKPLYHLSAVFHCCYQAVTQLREATIVIPEDFEFMA